MREAIKRLAWNQHAPQRFDGKINVDHFRYRGRPGTGAIHNGTRCDLTPVALNRFDAIPILEASSTGLCLRPAEASAAVAE